MELRQLRTFEMVAEYGSFTQVARLLHISQPAVSAQMQALENELHVQLLERLPRQVRLTPAGEMLCDYAHRLLNLESEAHRTLRELRGSQESSLRLGASPTIGAYVLPQMLAEFKRQRPELRLIAEIGATYHVVEALQSYAIDVGLVEAAVDSDALVIQPFLSDELVLAVPAGHPWAGRASVTPAELQEQPLIAREPGSGSRALVEESLRALGVEIVPFLELGGIEAIKNAVLAGLGVSFISRHAIQAEERLGILVAIPVEGLDLRRPFYCLHRRQRHLSPTVRAFLDLVLATGKS
jgi:DNA-binding transcriptional LysR family regulator